jgi:prepilin-type N-terminal cleavage/methylation domain-containing protein
MNAGRHDKRAGFSAVELMIAIVVLAIAVIGASLIPALSLGRGTEANTYAANVAREVLEGHRGSWLNRADFQSGTVNYTLPSGLRFGCTVDAPSIESYTFDGSYNLVVTTATPVMRKVTVSVKCNRGVEATLSTLIGDPDPNS